MPEGPIGCCWLVIGEGPLAFWVGGGGVGWIDVGGEDGFAVPGGDVGEVVYLVCTAAAIQA